MGRQRIAVSRREGGTRKKARRAGRSPTLVSTVGKTPTWSSG